MESKAKADAAATMLLLNEEKSQAKKKTRSTKNETVNMESKAKTDPADAAEAMILLNERMTCRKCRRKSNYPEQSYYGFVKAADSIRDLKCAFGNIKFVDILKVMRMEYNMLCDRKTGRLWKHKLCSSYYK